MKSRARVHDARTPVPAADTPGIGARLRMAAHAPRARRRAQRPAPGRPFSPSQHRRRRGADPPAHGPGLSTFASPRRGTTSALIPPRTMCLSRPGGTQSVRILIVVLFAAIQGASDWAPDRVCATLRTKPVCAGFEFLEEIRWDMERAGAGLGTTGQAVRELRWVSSSQSHLCSRAASFWCMRLGRPPNLCVEIHGSVAAGAIGKKVRSGRSGRLLRWVKSLVSG